MKSNKLYAASFGVSDYHQMSALSSACRDAQDLADVLYSAHNVAEVKLLLNEGVTKQTTLNTLAWLAKSSGPQDTAIIFFSGHGGRLSEDLDDQAFFCPVDATLQNLDETCISSGELTEALRGIKAARVAVLLDICYAGGFGDPRGNCCLRLTRGLTEHDLNQLIEGRGRMVFAASRPDERAWELQGMRNGLFTTYLLDGLRGGAARADGTVWASELFSHISREVRRHGSQHPYQKAIGEDFVIMVQPNVTKQFLPAHYPPSETDQRPLRAAIRSTYNRAELSLLCRDLGLSLEDLSGTTLEIQTMELIDYCQRHGQYKNLLELLNINRPHVFAG